MPPNRSAKPESSFQRKPIDFDDLRQSAARLASNRHERAQDKAATSIITIPEIDRECTVLVVNASQEMAKEMTMQLTLAIPACSIMYAPTIELARWILTRRKIDLVVSSAILPDGNIIKLKETFSKMATPPDVVVVGPLTAQNAKMLDSLGYQLEEVKRLGKVALASSPRTVPSIPVINRPPLNQAIRSLGADLRNDLNNPLQEIVAMVFVAQSGGVVSPSTTQALEAIDRAAKNMAHVVKALEDKIAHAVGSG